eukprot:3462467-Rhodomonas_salina.8
MLRAYVILSTDVCICLRACYALSGTDECYAIPGRGSGRRVQYRDPPYHAPGLSTICYAYLMPMPVLICRHGATRSCYA